MGEKHSKNKSKGITLIALIITVIIMLILVAVTIDIAVDGKLFDKAQDAVNKTNDKVGTTQNRVNDLMGYLNGTTGGNNNTTEGTPTECTHEYGEWEVVKEASCNEIGTKQATCTKCGETKQEEITKTAHGYANGVCPTCGAASTLTIGATIDYKEYISSDGTAFTTMPSYTAEAEKTGHSEDQVFTVTNNSGIEWIVLGEEDGQIKITTKNIVQPSSGGYTDGDYKLLRLYGQAGYTYFVDELHEIGAIYGKGKYADTSKFTVTTGGQTGGRSFIMEDLGYNSLTRTAAYTYAMHDNGYVYQHAVGEEIDLTTAGTTGGSSNTTFKYMTMDASNTTEETENGKVWNELKTQANGGPTSVTIYDYTYSGSETLSTTVSIADKPYYLTARLVDCSTSFVSLGLLYRPDIEYIYGYTLSYSFVRDDSGASGFRPVVYLNSEVQLTYDGSINSYTIK